MKHFIILILISSTSASLAQPAAQSSLGKLQWLAGTWTRTNTRPDRSAYEQWEASDSGLSGFAANVRGRDTVVVEKFKIIAEGGKLFYVADVPENKQPVYFEITSTTGASFACENPRHDFPKKIEYHLQADGKLLAQISDGSKKIDYWFTRRK